MTSSNFQHCSGALDSTGNENTRTEYVGVSNIFVDSTSDHGGKFLRLINGQECIITPSISQEVAEIIKIPVDTVVG